MADYGAPVADLSLDQPGGEAEVEGGEQGAPLSLEVPQLEPHVSAMASVDANALLNTLREVEMTLVDFHEKSDELPSWASSLMPRMANLERIMQRYGANMDKASGAKDEHHTLASMDVVEVENKVMESVRKETTEEINTAKYILDGKVENAVREMERLQLLLRTRPNQKEVHKIMEVVTDLGLDVRKTMGDATRLVDGMVTKTVTTEMETMAGRIGMSEKSLDASFNIANKKITAFNASLKEFESGIDDTNKKMNARLDQQQASGDRVAATLAQFKEEHELERIRLEKALGDISGSMEAAAGVFTDYRSKNAMRISKLEEIVKKSDSIQKSHAEKTEDRDMELQSNLNAVEAALGDFRKIYQSDVGKADAMLANLQDQLEGLHATQKTHIEYLDECKDVGIIEKAVRHEDVLEILKKRSKHHEDDLNLLQSKVISVGTMVANINDEMKKFPEQVAKTEGNLDRVILEINMATTNMGSLEETFKDTQNQVSELYQIREEIRAAQNEGEEQGNRVKAVFDQLSSILSKSEEHDKTIEDVFVNLEAGETNIQKTMDELKYNLMETVMSKQAEIEAQVENVKENVEMVMLTQNPMGGAFKASTPKPSRQSVAPPPAPANGKAGPGKGGMPAKGGVKGRGGGGGVNTGLQAIMATEDRKQGMVHGTTLGPQGTAHLTNAALRAEFNFTSQFVSDLCVSFEDINVRKGSVGELTPALCENLAGAAQGMAQLICTVVDSELMQSVLTGVEDETRIESEGVSLKRRHKLDVFVHDVIAHVNMHNSAPGQLRADSREFFIKRLFKVMDVCMSKHDQMMVVGNSRLGRTKIPSCIACDRPMMDKVRAQAAGSIDGMESMASFGTGAPAAKSLGTSAGFNAKVSAAK